MATTVGDDDAMRKEVAKQCEKLVREMLPALVAESVRQILAKPAADTKSAVAATEQKEQKGPVAASPSSSRVDTSAVSTASIASTDVSAPSSSAAGAQSLLATATPAAAAADAAYQLFASDEKAMEASQAFLKTVVGVHPETGHCKRRGCAIHAPSNHVLRGARLHWRDDRKLLERTCSHGIGHPDPDHLAYMGETQGEAARSSASSHGCDGCCRRKHP